MKFKEFWNFCLVFFEFLLVWWIFMNLMRNACIKWMWFVLRRLLVQQIPNPVLSRLKSKYHLQNSMDVLQTKTQQSAEFRDVCKSCATNPTCWQCWERFIVCLERVISLLEHQGSAIAWIGWHRSAAVVNSMVFTAESVTEGDSHPFFLLSMPLISWGRRNLS